MELMVLGYFANGSELIKTDNHKWYRLSKAAWKTS